MIEEFLLSIFSSTVLYISFRTWLVAYGEKLIKCATTLAGNEFCKPYLIPRSQAVCAQSHIFFKYPSICIAIYITSVVALIEERGEAYIQCIFISIELGSQNHTGI